MTLKIKKNVEYSIVWVGFLDFVWISTYNYLFGYSPNEIQTTKLKYNFRNIIINWFIRKNNKFDKFKIIKIFLNQTSYQRTKQVVHRGCFIRWIRIAIQKHEFSRNSTKLSVALTKSSKSLHQKNIAESLLTRKENKILFRSGHLNYSKFLS